MQSMWTMTLNAGDVVRIPQDSYIWCNNLTSKTKTPLYGILVRQLEVYSEVLIDGFIFCTNKDNIFPGS
jgi:hypothetical protein